MRSDLTFGKGIAALKMKCRLPVQCYLAILPFLLVRFLVFEADLFIISHFFFCFPHSKSTFELHFELNLVSRKVLSTKDCANYYFSSLSVPTVPVTSSPTPTTAG